MKAMRAKLSKGGASSFPSSAEVAVALPPVLTACRALQRARALTLFAGHKASLSLELGGTHAGARSEVDHNAGDVLTHLAS